MWLPNTIASDRHSFRFLRISLALIVIGELTDDITTAYALHIGDTERNPVGVAALTTTGPLIYVIKLTAAIALAILIWRSRNRRWALPLAMTIAVLTCLPGYGNLVTLLRP